MLDSRPLQAMPHPWSFSNLRGLLRYSYIRVTSGRGLSLRQIGRQSATAECSLENRCGEPVRNFVQSLSRKTTGNPSDKSLWDSHWKSSLDISDAGTVYNFDTIDVDGKPEPAFMCLNVRSET